MSMILEESGDYSLFVLNGIFFQVRGAVVSEAIRTLEKVGA